PIAWTPGTGAIAPSAKGSSSSCLVPPSSGSASWTSAWRWASLRPLWRLVSDHCSGPYDVVDGEKCGLIHALCLLRESAIESPGRDGIMATGDTRADIPAEGVADLGEICRRVYEGKQVTDPALLKRIYDPADEIQRGRREKHGVLEWAVDLIRECSRSARTRAVSCCKRSANSSAVRLCQAPMRQGHTTYPSRNSILPLSSTGLPSWSTPPSSLSRRSTTSPSKGRTTAMRRSCAMAAASG